ncbi:hypothetical protein ES708_05764 [subsurface metagenome]
MRGFRLDSKIKKICHLTSVHTPFDTRIFHKECKSLAGVGYEVHLIAAHDREEIVDGIHMHPVRQFSGKIKRMLNATREVYKKALVGNYDAYHFHDPELIPFGVLLKLRGKTVVYDIHEDYPEYFKHKDAFPKALRIPFAVMIGILERFACGHFDSLVTVTPHIYQRIAKLNKRSYLIRNFPDIEDSSPDIHDIPWESRSDTVAYVGSVSADRGVREMVEAIGLIQSDISDARLLLAGAFTGKAIEREISKMPGYVHVEYFGQAPRSKVIHILNRSKIGIVVCHPLEHYKHAYSTKLFEYMSAGIPVIASDFPLWRKIVEDSDCGIVVPPLDPKAIARAALQLLKNPSDAEKMGKNGKEAVKNIYNWENEKRTLLELYKELI